MEGALDAFLRFMQQQRQRSPNTIDAYRRDLRRYLDSLARQGLETMAAVRQEHVASLLRTLHDAGLKPSTIARNLTSIKRFHHFLLRQDAASHDPTENLEPPRLERKLPEVLTVDEIDRLLSAPDISDPLGRRDRSMLELLYASGLRVSELIALSRRALLLDSALLRIVDSRAHERLIPVGRQAVFHLENYLRDVRPRLLSSHSDDTVFLNARGGALSRMSIWKIIRAAAQKAQLDKEVSPHTLRHSFAAHLLEGGANLRVVQELLGHADISTTQIYARVDITHLKEVHRKYHPRGG